MGLSLHSHREFYSRIYKAPLYSPLVFRNRGPYLSPPLLCHIFVLRAFVCRSANGMDLLKYLITWLLFFFLSLFPDRLIFGTCIRITENMVI